MRIKEVALLWLSCLLLVAQAQNPTEFDDDDGVEVEVVEDAPKEQLAEEVVYESPKYNPEQFYFVDHFDDVQESSQRWVKSQAKKDDIAEELAKYDGEWQWEAPQRIVSKKDIGLVLKSKAKHAAIAAPLRKVFNFAEEKPLVVQYEVTMQDGQECGGSYIKLLSAGKQNEDLTKFNDKTPYTIMFGPDKCGNDIKMHFIFRHVNPINGSITEKHCQNPKERLEEPFKDKLPHLYTLIVRPDNTFEVRVDDRIVNEGSLLSEFKPPVNPAREIDDPEDVKPQEWDEREKIPDPAAHKPDDWDDEAPPQIPDPKAIQPEGWLEDEPALIPDPNTVKPEDWDADMDGEWEAPLVDNPICQTAVGCGPWKAPLIDNVNYKGKWRAPLIENPNYQGKWAARKIPNPDFFEDLTPFKMTPISAIGIELWSMSSDILFDNLIITDSVVVARDFAAKSFELKRKHIDKESETLWKKIVHFFTVNTWATPLAILLFGTPLAFTLYRLFSKGGSKESAENAKKTDAVQPDDPQAVAEEQTTTEANATENAAAAAKASPKRKKKSDLDVKVADVSARDSPKASVEAEEEEEQDEEEQTEANETEDSTSKPSTSRKRRTRRDES